jgi:hypothetical protein
VRIEREDYFSQRSDTHGAFRDTVHASGIQATRMPPREEQRSGFDVTVTAVQQIQAAENRRAAALFVAGDRDA